MIKSSSQSKRRPAASRPAARVRRRARPHRDRHTEQRILDAAHTVFVRAGTAGARTQEIAKEAGVNSALLHYYFRTKERLAEAVFRRAASQLFPTVLRILGSTATLEQKIEQVIRVETDNLSAAPYLPAYILSELAHHPERAPQLAAAMGIAPADVGATVFGVLQKQIDARVRERRMFPIAADQFVVNLLALCVFPFAARPMLAVLLRVQHGGFDTFVDQRRRELPAFFLRALRP